MKKRKKNTLEDSSIKIVGKYIILFAGYILLSIATGIIVMNFLTKPEIVVVPELKGESIDNALVKLSDMGLNVRISGKKYDRKIPPYHVISTTPESLNKVKKGRIVEVVLSKGMVKSFVPELSGKNYLEAELLISKAQLNLGKIIRVHSDSYPEDTTISTFPAEENEVASGSKVNILVSAGTKEKTFIMPDLTGISKKEANAVIKAMKAKPGNIKNEWNNILPSGHIISHNPSAGNPVKENSTIDFLVSTGRQKKTKSTGVGNDNTSTVKTYRTYSFTVPEGNKVERHIVAKIYGKNNESREIYNKTVPKGKLINLFFEIVEGTKLSIYLDGDLFLEKEY